MMDCDPELQLVLRRALERVHAKADVEYDREVAALDRFYLDAREKVDVENLDQLTACREDRLTVLEENRTLAVAEAWTKELLMVFAAMFPNVDGQKFLGDARRALRSLAS